MATGERMKHYLVIFPLALFLSGCATIKPQHASANFSAQQTHLQPHLVPSELLVIRVEVDGHRVAKFDATVNCGGYASSTGWQPANKNGEVIINYGQSDELVTISVRSTVPSQTFVAATHKVRLNTLPPTPLVFSLSTKNR